MTPKTLQDRHGNEVEILGEDVKVGDAVVIKYEPGMSSGSDYLLSGTRAHPYYPDHFIVTTVTKIIGSEAGLARVKVALSGGSYAYDIVFRVDPKHLAS